MQFYLAGLLANPPRLTKSRFTHHVRVGWNDACITGIAHELRITAKRLPSEYSTRSIASHVRNVVIPSKNSDVDQFLDELFEPVSCYSFTLRSRLKIHMPIFIQVLQSNGTTIEDLYEANSLAASIKGGGGAVTQAQPAVGATQTPNFAATTNNASMSAYTILPAMNQPVIMMLPIDGMSSTHMSCFIQLSHSQLLSQLSAMQMFGFQNMTAMTQSMSGLPFSPFVCCLQPLLP